MIEQFRDERRRRKAMAVACGVMIWMVLCLILPLPSHGASTPQKDARVNNDPIDNGSASNPVSVSQGDRITYEILTEKSAPAGAKYDIIFALDWSGSMNGLSGGGHMYGTGRNNMISAREYARDLIMAMSQNIFQNYPDSRIAIMGMNAFYGNKNEASNANLQYDTPFVGAGQYSQVIATSLAANPQQRMDDVAQFLRAAIDKMKGDTSVVYGQNISTPSMQLTARPVVARDELNAGRIPVIVLISDFQMRDDTGGTSNDPGFNQSGRRYWAECMRDQSVRFANAFPDGVLLTIRLDHVEDLDRNASNGFNWGNNKVNENIFNSSTYDTLMTALVSPAGHANWKFTKLKYDVLPADGLNEVKSAFNAAAPPPVSTSIADTIPDGLTIRSTNPAAVVNNQKVTWDLTSAQPGQIKLTVVTEVTAPPQNAGGNYVNTAVLSEAGKADVNTNTTYHRLMSDRVLHIRQIVLNPRSGTQKPAAGYFRLVNNSRAMPIAADSGVHGYGLTDYTTCNLTLEGNDNKYQIYDFIPQYYEYAGHFQNSGSAAANGHDSLSGMATPAQIPNGGIQLDYGAKSEYWATVYIRPVGVPDDYEWSYASNDFGAIK